MQIQIEVWGVKQIREQTNPISPSAADLPTSKTLTMARMDPRVEGAVTASPNQVFSNIHTSKTVLSKNTPSFSECGIFNVTFLFAKSSQNLSCVGGFFS